jgi:histidyl-tRNA synthetase
MDRSLKAQMKYADKKGFAYTIVLGDDEIEAGKGVLKDMRTGEQKDVSLDSIVDRLKNQAKQG